MQGACLEHVATRDMFGECYARASMRRALIVVGKAPLAGSTKTRLVPPLSPQDAAELYHGFLIDTLEMAASLTWERTSLVHPRGDGMQLAQLAGKSPVQLLRAAWRGSRQRASVRVRAPLRYRLRAGHPDRQRQSDTVLGASSRGLQCVVERRRSRHRPHVRRWLLPDRHAPAPPGGIRRHRLEHPARLRPDAVARQGAGPASAQGGRVVRRGRVPADLERLERSSRGCRTVRRDYARHTRRLALAAGPRSARVAPAASASRPERRSVRTCDAHRRPGAPAGGGRA